ncbi:hypothetical protein [Endozoicomonas sp. 4G]|uniref:hypothetical protein n=1 Tax=Endozoicomonas sp. 4G TaxID=2872754 RepID=UPI0020787ACF|nr:hypothetical protein [Endozoicomonas sp. 4G]
MNAKRTLIILASFAGLSCAHADVCSKADIVVSFKIQNHTNEDMLLDMGNPSYGVTQDGKRKFVVFSQETVEVKGCSDSPIAGFESYVRLYGNNYRYMFDWYVDMPLYGDHGVNFHRYTPNHSCDVTYSCQHHSYKKMQAYQSFDGEALKIKVTCHD